MRAGYNRVEIIAFLERMRGDLFIREFAAKLGVSPQYMGQVLNGRALPGPSILKHFGLQSGYIESDPPSPENGDGRPDQSARRTTTNPASCEERRIQ